MNVSGGCLYSGLTEEWDASVEMMEKLLPTYFEGFHANISTQTCSAKDDVSVDVDFDLCLSWSS